MRSLALLPLALVVILNACGSGSTQVVGLRDQPPAQTDRAGSFELKVWPQTFIAPTDSGQFDLNLYEDGDSAVVTVSVAKATNLRALYVSLQFDDQAWSPVAVQPSAAMGADGEMLRLPVLDAATGRVDYGQVLLRPESQPGLSGDAVLLTVRFQRGRVDDAQRSSSALAIGPRSQPYVLWERQKDFKLRWNFGGPGDYDQNGETNISDLTALAKVFGEHGSFPPFAVNAVVDGDGNGEINLADVTVIGQNYGTRVGGYNIYAADSTGLSGWLPGSPVPAPGLLIGSVGRDDAQTNASGAVSLEFDLGSDFGQGVEGLDSSPILDRSDPGGQYVFGLNGANEIPQATLLVVPFDGTEEGSRPAILGGAPSELSFELTPSVTGTGSRSDPFMLALGTDYELNLVHPTLGPVDADYQHRVFAVPAGSDAASHGASSHTHSPDPLIVPKATEPDYRVRFTTDLDGLDVNDLVYVSDFFYDPVPGTPVSERLLGDPGPAVYFFFDRPQLNQAPIPVIIVTPPQPEPWQDIMINGGTSFDPEGDPLTFEWDLGSDGVYEFPPLPDPILVLPAEGLNALPNPNRVPVTLRVYDGTTQVEEGILLIRNAPPLGSDDSPPVVQIVSPTPGSSAAEGSVFPFIVTATDDLGVARVDYYVDDVIINSGVITPPDPSPALGEVPLVLNGTGFREFSVRAIDQAGNTTWAPAVTLEVEPDGPPTVDIVAPPVGSTIFAGVPFIISCDASDDLGIHRVEFIVNDVVIEEVVVDPPQVAVADLFIEHTVPTPGPIEIIVRAHDSNMSVQSFQAFEVVTPNLAPTALFTIPQPEIRVGFPLLIDASTSSDPDGSIVSYEVDLDGDTVAEITSALPEIIVDPGLFSAGALNLSLTVEDGGGLRDTFGQLLLVDPAPQWQESAVDGGGGDIVGCFPSLAFVDGHIACAYLDVNNQHLLFIRATNPQGSNWEPPVIVDSSANTGWFPTLVGQEHFASPCIAYWRQTNQDLYFASAQNAQGSAWNAPVPVAAGAPVVGRGASLCKINGNPAIGFYNNDRPGLDFVRAQGPGGGVWNAPVPVADGAVNNEARTSLHIGPDGFALLAYHLDGNLYLKSALDANGGNWGSPLLVHGGAGFGHDLAVRGEHVGVAFFDAGSSKLQFKGGVGLAAGDWHDDPPQDIGIFSGTTGYVGLTVGQPPYSGVPIWTVYGGSTMGSNVAWKGVEIPGGWNNLPPPAPGQTAQYGDACLNWSGVSIPSISRFDPGAGTLKIACCL